ncbi:M20/M25/M40 family metallo-hydrolase [Marinoscillum furvescens]|uniref:Putative aminopeptidase FrvX n=1 Tax=Marinoscillum furvescens DSM 4134 TaxID=1122208 RepID=A0A3D9L3G2_MARFU|nr:M20/M25/M40 family metallo-hydrolase [Marinoscillum furvescens]RED99783.1 putative aminopeptidase FrvX [Marinoscillum furvescens DSM 4134]
MKLLEQLIDIASPSGSEYHMRDFLVKYVKDHQSDWKVAPKILYGDELQDNLILVFGDPRTAIFAHMDTIGFTVRYQDQLVPIGGPDAETGYELVGKDAMGFVDCTLRVDDENQLFYDFPRAIATGTTLTWKPTLKLDGEYIEGPYMDNRLGIYNALKVAESLEHGVIVFSSFEEHGGGSVPLLVQYLAQHYPAVRQALISDITWVTEGVRHGEGVAISMRDRNIPRRKFLDRVLDLAAQSGIAYQLEVEGGGSSDGREVHHSPYPIDWLFIGAPEDQVHSPKERVHMKDLIAMISMYKYLMERL